jgi:hypothetical protein
LILVDTPAQLDVVHQDRGAWYSVRDYVAAHSANRAIRVRVTTEFETSRDEVDVAFCVAVFDVVPPATRQRILRSAARNIRRGGYLALIIPRNDSTILERCGSQNRRWDGHWFRNHDGFTFYRNFRDTTALARTVERAGFQLDTDLSRYRQVCLLFRRVYR